jgi:hypothetical protein
MLGIVFAQCWIHSLSPFAYWSKGTCGLRAAEGIVAATAGIYGAITSSCSTQKDFLAAHFVSETVESWNGI